MRLDRLSEKNDIKKLFRGGRRARTPLFSFLWLKNDRKHQRILCVVTKKNIKSSVARNRVRRRVNEWFRKNKDPSSPIDILVVVDGKAAGVPKKAFYKDLSDGAKKITL